MGKIPHDFRRTGVWNMVRAGISERVVMSLASHKTRAVSDRYHIVSDGDLREAAQKLDHTVSTLNGHNFRHTAHAGRAEKPLSA